ncbi:MAG: DUF2207 domain-containing protein [Clostridia bacterium]|nr:DUF2207 domain-containing protein [Clostridia bacterium]
MKQKLLSIVTAAIICFTGFAFISPEAAFAEDSSQGFMITDFDVDARVHENNSIDIRETIKVNFSKRKHGIYRNIPSWLRVNASIFEGSNSIYEYACKVDNENVKGHQWKFGDCDQYNTVLVIGDPDVKVKGKQTYVISYTYIYPDDRIDDFDFIYHNLLGDQWQVPIRHFSFKMKFDKDLPEDAVKDLQIFSGARGTASNALGVDFKASKSSLTGSVSDIEPGEAVTVMAKLPEGYYRGERSTSPVPSLLGLMIALAGVVLVLLARLRTRRNKPVATVEFHAPDDISPAEVGTIIDEVADDKDLLSLIPWFADRGYLTVRIVEKERKVLRDKELVELTKVKDLPEDAPQYQKSFFNLLFEDGDVRLMDNLGESFGKAFLEAKEELSAEFRGDRKLSTGTLKACVLSGIITIGAAMFYGFSSCVALMENFVPGVMAAMFFGTTVIVCGMVKGGRRKVLSSIIIGIMLALELVNIRLFCDEENSLMPPIVYLIAFVVFGAASILAGYLIKPTDYKLAVLGKLLGLKEFIKVAEMDKLKALVSENPNYFFDILPFAMAFGLTEKWSKHFEKIDIQNPAWYRGGHTGDTFTALAIGNMINTSAGSSISGAVSSASSSGGGSSGGGGGGGGGGSW